MRVLLLLLEFAATVLVLALLAGPYDTPLQRSKDDAIRRWW